MRGSWCQGVVLRCLLLAQCTQAGRWRCGQVLSERRAGGCAVAVDSCYSAALLDQGADSTGDIAITLLRWCTGPAHSLDIVFGGTRCVSYAQSPNQDRTRESLVTPPNPEASRPFLLYHNCSIYYHTTVLANVLCPAPQPPHLPAPPYTSPQLAPPDVSHLQSLRSLDVSRNALGGLPRGVTALRALQALEAHRNRLVALPEGLGAMAGLTRLVLARCAAAGQDLPCPYLECACALKVFPAQELSRKTKPSSISAGKGVHGHARARSYY